MMMTDRVRKRLRTTFVAAGLWVGLTTGLQVAQATDTGTEVVVYSLSFPSDGSVPENLVQLPSGVFYGMTFTFPTTGNPEIFSITTGGTYTALSNFCTSSSCPLGNYASGFVVGTDHNLYTATGSGGSSFDGAFLKVTPAGVISSIYDFTTLNPTQVSSFAPNLLLGSDGNFYGTAQEGDRSSTVNPSGGIYKMTPAGAFSLIYPFTAMSGSGTNVDGARPQSALVQASDGNFYGTASYGGPNGTGTVFEVTPGGVLTVLYAFSHSGIADGEEPVGGLVIGTDGNFYGTANLGGVNGFGTLFKITSTPDHTFTKLHDFGATTAASITFPSASATVAAGQSYSLAWNFTDASQDGGNPLRSLVLGNDGNFYGATYGFSSGNEAGVAFQITPAGVYTILHQFGGTSTDLNGNPVTDGSQAYGMILGADGNFYGTTGLGGANNDGTIFRLSVGPSQATPPCVASGAWSGNFAASGTQSVSQSTAGSYTYTLTCLESNGTHISGSFQLIVSGSGAAAPTATLVANPTSITLGQSATLTWSSANATACTAANGWSGARATSGTLAVTPTAAGTTTYQLTCSGAGGTANASATLAVTAVATPAPTVTLNVAPASIVLGSSAALTWSSDNATRCAASGAWSGTQSTAGNLTVTPSAAGSATYTLICTGTGGSASASATLAVSTAPSITVLSGKAGGGGGLGIGTLMGLGLLAVLRFACNYSRLGSRSLLGIALLAPFGVLLQVAPATAQDAQSTPEFRWQQPYVGVRLGSGTYSETGGSFNADLVSAGDTVSSGTIARHEFSGVAYVGVPFYQSLALEFGYADLGTYPVRITTAAANVTQVAESAVQRLAPAGRGLTLNLALPLNFNPWFAIEPRLGVLAYDSRQEVFTPVGRISQNRAGAGADGGLSLLVHANRQFDLGAGVDCFGTNHACNVLLLSADIEFHFGR
jgi:uncharacterized repeat protein (TIGR03803 family)